MNTFQKNINYYTTLALVSAIALVVVLIVQYSLKNQIMDYLDMVTVIIDLLIGLISTLILLILIEKRDSKRDRLEYGYLHGHYKRLDRYNEAPNNPNTKWALVQHSDSPEMEMIYKGNREYEIPSINYDSQWFAKATIVMDSSKKTGTGIFHYTKLASSIREDFGTYQLYVDSIDENKIYIFHRTQIL